MTNIELQNVIGLALVIVGMLVFTILVQILEVVV